MGKNPPTTRATRGQGPDGSNGMVQCDSRDASDKGMETSTGAGDAEYLPEYFKDADGDTTKNGKHPRREYDKVALEASERGQASAGPATEDGHGAMTHNAGQIQEEEGYKDPRRASASQDPNGGDTEESPPPQTVTRA